MTDIELKSKVNILEKKIEALKAFIESESIVRLKYINIESAKNGEPSLVPETD